MLWRRRQSPAVLQSPDNHFGVGSLEIRRRLLVLVGKCLDANDRLLVPIRCELGSRVVRG